MGTIDPQHAAGMTDADTFDVDGHNEDLCGINGTWLGLITEPNGGLVSSNLDAGFRVTKDMIQPGESTWSEAGGDVDRLDYMGDLCRDLVAGNEVFIPVAGASRRIKLPYDVTALLWEAHIFHCHWRLWQPAYGELPLRTADILTRFRVDGSIIQESLRPHSPTAYIVPAGGTPKGYRDEYELIGAADLAQHYTDLNVAKGTHDFRFEVYVGIVKDGGTPQGQWTYTDTFTKFNGDETAPQDKSVLPFNRFTKCAGAVKASWWK